MYGALAKRIVPPGVNPGLVYVFDGLAAMSFFGRLGDPALVAASRGLEGAVLWDLVGEGGTRYTMHVHGGAVRIVRGRAAHPVATVRTSVIDFFRWLTGSTAGDALLRSGALAIEGDARAFDVGDRLVASLRDLYVERSRRGRLVRSWLDFATRVSRTGFRFDPGS